MDAKHLTTTFQLDNERLQYIAKERSNSSSIKNLGYSLLGFTQNRSEYENDQGIQLLSTWFPGGRFLTMENESLIQHELGLPCETSEKLADLYKLQKFRIDNANDCFSTHHQFDLKLDRHGNFQTNTSEKIKTPLPLTNERKTPTTKPIPYALRQRLLRFQLEGEEKESVSRKRFRIQ